MGIFSVLVRYITMLMITDKRYRWVKYDDYNCEVYHVGQYTGLRSAMWACIKDRRCSAISVLECDPNQVLGLCREDKIGIGSWANHCMYKKGNIRK